MSDSNRDTTRRRRSFSDARTAPSFARFHDFTTPREGYDEVSTIIASSTNHAGDDFNDVGGNGRTATAATTTTTSTASADFQQQPRELAAQEADTVEEARTRADREAQERLASGAVQREPTMRSYYSEFVYGNWGNPNIFTENRTSTPLLHPSNYNRLPGLRSTTGERVEQERQQQQQHPRELAAREADTVEEVRTRQEQLASGAVQRETTSYSYSDFDWGNWGNSNFFTDSRTSLLHPSNYNRLPGLRSTAGERVEQEHNQRRELAAREEETVQEARARQEQEEQERIASEAVAAAERNQRREIEAATRGRHSSDEGIIEELNDISEEGKRLKEEDISNNKNNNNKRSHLSLSTSSSSSSSSLLIHDKKYKTTEHESSTLLLSSSSNTSNYSNKLTVTPISLLLRTMGYMDNTMLLNMCLVCKQINELIKNGEGMERQLIRVFEFRPSGGNPNNKWGVNTMKLFLSNMNRYWQDGTKRRMLQGYQHMKIYNTPDMFGVHTRFDELARLISPHLRMTGIVDLDISSPVPNRILGNQGLLHLVALLVPNLRKLDISNFRTEEDIFIELPQLCPHLEVLKWNKWNNDDGFDVIPADGRFLKSFKDLKELYLDGGKFSFTAESDEERRMADLTNHPNVFFFHELCKNNLLERVSIRHARSYSLRHARYYPAEFDPIAQNVLINFVRNVPSTLVWFRSDLSTENIRMLQLERPGIELVN